MSAAVQESQTRIQFPEKLRALFRKSRYKVLHGGRGGAKSWGIARALLLKGSQAKLRILCTREIQNSIKDSVHKLLSDQIEAMGLGDFYDVLETEIRGKNGTEFIFAGLSKQTIQSIKSYEGIDICWVEEAQNVSKNSWKVLSPTIRKPGSEIWVSFNPELDTDETYKRFVTNPPPDSIVIEINYHDNPWFPPELEAERLHCLATEPDDYDNIWEGKCRAAVAGAIYAKEVMQAVKDGRHCNVPYDPRLKVHTIWDLGLDTTSIIMAQKGVAEVRVINYLQDVQMKLDYYAAELQKLNYNWGWDWLPHDGHTENVKSHSAYYILKSFGRRVKPKVGEKCPIPNISVEVGIRAVRLLYPRLVIDKVKGADLIECHKRYRRNIPVSTGEPATPIHDKYSHGCDATRYLALIADQLTNDEEYEAMPKMKPYRPTDAGMGALG